MNADNLPRPAVTWPESHEMVREVVCDEVAAGRPACPADGPQCEACTWLVHRSVVSDRLDARLIQRLYIDVEERIRRMDAVRAYCEQVTAACESAMESEGNTKIPLTALREHMRRIQSRLDGEVGDV